jgi:hypothetical protein
VWRIDDLAHADIADPVAALVLGAPPVVDTLLVGGHPVVEHGALRTVSTVDASRALAKQAARMREGMDR